MFQSTNQSCLWFYKTILQYLLIFKPNKRVFMYESNVFTYRYKFMSRQQIILTDKWDVPYLKQISSYIKIDSLCVIIVILTFVNYNHIICPVCLFLPR